MPTNKIDAIMGTQDSLGESGEAILIGGMSQRLSQSRFSEESRGMNLHFKSDFVDKAPGGESGVGYDFVDGVEYIAAYAPVDITGFEWVMMARMRSDEALSDANTLTLAAATVALVGALVVVVFAWWLGSRLNSTLGADPAELLQLAQRIGEGDLTESDSKVTSVGAYGAMVQMRTRLRDVMREASRVSAEVKSGVSEISQNNRGLNERTEQQTSSLETTASSTEELTSTVKHNANNARSANSLPCQWRFLRPVTPCLANWVWWVLAVSACNCRHRSIRWPGHR